MSTRNISINIIWTLLVLLAMDAYVYSALRKSIQKSKWKPFLNVVYVISVVLSYIGFYYLYFYFTVKPLEVNLAPNLAIGFFFSLVVVKILLVLFFLFEDIFRFLEFVCNLIRSYIRADKESINRKGQKRVCQASRFNYCRNPFYINVIWNNQRESTISG